MCIKKPRKRSRLRRQSQRNRFHNWDEETKAFFYNSLSSGSVIIGLECRVSGSVRDGNGRGELCSDVWQVLTGINDNKKKDLTTKDIMRFIKTHDRRGLNVMKGRERDPGGQRGKYVLGYNGDSSGHSRACRL